MEIVNTLTGGVRINSKRIEIQFDHSPIRDFGQYGIYMGATDCHYKNGAIGVGRNCVIVAAGANWITKSGFYSATDYAIALTDRASDSFIIGNQIDNNLGGGISAIGLASNTLNTLIEQNIFRGNSRSGDGLYPDIYLEQVRNILLVGNVSGVQQGSPAKTSHAERPAKASGSSTPLRICGTRIIISWTSTRITTQFIHDRDAPNYVAGAGTTAIMRCRVGSDAYERAEMQANGTLRMGPVLAR